jgi:hypothetical protein
MPNNVDLRIKKKPQANRAERLSNARDKTSIYALSQDSTMSEKEREEMRKQLKERFTPGARPMPTSIRGLAALANERIEDAIARGQFKNIPRGKGKNIERDYNASSPFLDTTEYFMNKIIQKQDIVPPWIEKQQELVKAAHTFRTRLRNDWKRHAARVIASRGGSLDSQVKRAQAYARAEEANNPRAVKKETLSTTDVTGVVEQVVVTEIPANTAEYATITISEAQPEPTPDILTEEGSSKTSADPPIVTAATYPTYPFRDATWEKLELPYHNLALKSLNDLTRSYNLMAPDLAKKPYFSLNRELQACFADVAPQIAAEITERARTPARIKVEVVGHRPGGVLERFGGQTATVYDTRRPNYGFKDFWRDLWGKKESRAM